MANENNEAILIHNALQLTAQIRNCPVERLVPHLEHIKHLLNTTTQVYTSLSAQKNPENVNCGRATVQRSRRVTAANALKTALETALSLERRLEQYVANEELIWLGQDADARTNHLQTIFSLQRTASPEHSDARDRLLMACSCHSLSLDFELFEDEQGWQSLHSSLVERITSGQDAAVQRHGKHNSKFFSQMNYLDTHREKLDAGLRLGTKMRLLEAIGRELNIGGAMELLFAFECQKLSRLTYAEIGLLRTHLLVSDTAEFRRLQEFGQKFSPWWNNTLFKYHERYGKFKPPVINHPGTHFSHGLVDPEASDKSTSGSSLVTEFDSDGLWPLFDGSMEAIHGISTREHSMMMVSNQTFDDHSGCSNTDMNQSGPWWDGVTGL